MKHITLANLDRAVNKIKELFVRKESGKGLSSNDLTNTLKGNYDAAYTHSQSAHAPSGAQVNVIEKVKVNGNDLSVASKAVNVTVPTKVSELTNDSNFLSKHPTVTTATDSTSAASPAAGSTFTAVDAVTRDTNGHVTKVNTKTVTLPAGYTHPNSGVTAGTYKSVTVNAQGHVTAATNPTTLAGYGITDAPTTTAMNTAIANAVGSAGHLKRLKVASLPAVGSANVETIYMILKTSGKGDNVYDEYMVMDSKWEKIGDTEVDLTGYIHEDDIEEVTDAEIDALFV